MFLFSFHACMSGYITYRALELCFATFSPHGSNFSSLYVMFMLQSSRLVIKTCYIQNPTAVMVAGCFSTRMGSNRMALSPADTHPTPPFTHWTLLTLLFTSPRVQTHLCSRDLLVHTLKSIFMIPQIFKHGLCKWEEKLLSPRAFGHRISLSCQPPCVPLKQWEASDNHLTSSTVLIKRSSQNSLHIIICIWVSTGQSSTSRKGGRSVQWVLRHSGSLEWGRKDPANVSHKTLASSFPLCFFVGKIQVF